MTAMSVPSTGFRVGYALGTLAREFLRATKRPGRSSPESAQPRPGDKLASFSPTRNDWDELCRIPTIARRGADLNQWFEANTKPVPARRPRKRKQAQVEAPQLRMGPLDELIAPVAPI